MRLVSPDPGFSCGARLRPWRRRQVGRLRGLVPVAQRPQYQGGRQRRDDVHRDRDDENGVPAPSILHEHVRGSRCRRAKSEF